MRRNRRAKKLMKLICRYRSDPEKKAIQSASVRQLSLIWLPDVICEMDHQTRKPYAVVNEMIADTLFPNEDAIHKAITMDHQTYTIVGVFQEEMPEEGIQATIGEFFDLSTPIFIPRGAYQSVCNEFRLQF